MTQAEALQVAIDDLKMPVIDQTKAEAERRVQALRVLREMHRHLAS